MSITVELRDADYRRIGEVDNLTELEVQLAFNGVGTWRLEVPFTADYDFSRGVVISRNGTVLMSGPVTGLERSWSARGDTLSVRGVDDSVHLARRLAYPSPDGDFTAQARDSQTMIAESLLRYYVGVNAGPGALAERQVPGLVLAPDEARGPTISAGPRFTNLLELLREKALTAGLGFRVVQVGTALEFQVYEPTDRTATAEFSRTLGNLRGFTHGGQAPDANYAIVGGEGQGINRTFVERSDSDSITKYGRIEAFVDQRNTSDLAELRQGGDEHLAESAEQVSLELEPVDTEAVTFGVDYGLGDRVSVFVDSTTIRDVVRKVTLRWGSAGERIVPQVTTPGRERRTVLRIFDDIRRLRTRIGHLESSE